MPLGDSLRNTLRKSFKFKKPKGEESLWISNPLPLDDVPQELALANLYFINNSVKTERVVTFFNQLISNILEKKQTKERDKIRYKGLGYIAFISYVFFNSGLKANIKISNESQKTIAFEIDVNQVQFSQLGSITSEDIDNFVAGEKIDGKEVKKVFLHSIRHQYPNTSFPEDIHPPGSIDWATFRTEINEVIFQLLELSQAEVKKMLQIESSRESKEDKEVSDIMTQLGKIREASGKSETYAIYKASCPISTTTETLERRYRESQFFKGISGPGRRPPVINVCELAEDNNNEGSKSMTASL